jgi:hypothetical protein
VPHATAQTNARRVEPGLFRIVPAAATPLAACVSTAVSIERAAAQEGGYPPPSADEVPECHLAFGHVRTSRSNKIREAAGMDVPMSIDEEGLWLALRTAAGWQYVAVIDAFPPSSMGTLGMAMTRMAFEDVFAGGERELVVEWRAVQSWGEEVGNDAGSGDTSMTGVTVCSWSGRPFCRTIPRTWDWVERRYHNERLRSTVEHHAQLAVDLQSSGTVVVSAQGDIDHFAPIVGTHTWPEVPVLPLSAIFDGIPPQWGH